jgi:hypothetical protein
VVPLKWHAYNDKPSCYMQACKQISKCSRTCYIRCMRR